MFDRRRLLTGLGGIVAGLLDKSSNGAGVDVGSCEIECKPQSTSCSPGEHGPAYGEAPGKRDFASALKTVRANFTKGLSVNGHATAEEVALFLKNEAGLLQRRYEHELKFQVQSGVFETGSDHGKETWYILNDHAYILGQLTASMVEKKQNAPNGWEPVGRKSFLRARRHFARATSREHCNCFITAGAYHLPKELPHTRELDKDCCLC